MKTDKQIILLSKIKDLERQLHNHISARTRARVSRNSKKEDFENSCIKECHDRIRKAKEELSGL